MGNCWPSPVVSPSPGTTKHYNPAPNHWARTEQSKSTENRASLPLPPPAKEGRRAVGEEVPPCGRIVTPNLRIYTYAELKTATKNFRPDTVLGEGGFGRVFKGWVDEKTHAPSKAGVGVPVAVKKSNPDSSQGLKEWQMDPTFADQLAAEWSRLQDFLENTVGSNFSFRDPYVPAEFPIMYGQYQQLRANAPNQREVYTAQNPSPWRRAILEQEIREILESIPGFDIRSEPYDSHYRDMENQPPIPTLDGSRNPSSTSEEDETANLVAEVESLKAFMTNTPDFPMGDEYLAGMFPALYRMRQAHQKIAALFNVITRSTVEEHKIREMLGYILGVEMGTREEPPEEDEDPEEPPEEEEDPEDTVERQSLLAEHFPGLFD